VSFIESTPPPRGRVAVPGCGRGHDARYLARQGYEVVAFDFSEAALREARALARAEGVTVDFQQRDIFALPPEYANVFDGIWEYTCFCAIDPARRHEYVSAMSAILKSGGWLLACFFPMRAGGAGPPFPVRKAEVRRLFVPPFRIEREYRPLHSVRLRQGLEWMVFARKTATPA
jgi:SAM-dependent methyltransferase